MNVVSLTSPSPDRDSERTGRITKIFRSMPWFPDQCDDDPYSTGLGQFSDDDAARLAEFFDCFCITVPSDAYQPAILEAWDYLWKNYGRFIDLKLRGTMTFPALTSQWAPEQHAFLNALIAGSIAKVKTLGTRNGFFETVQGILACRDSAIPLPESTLRVVPRSNLRAVKPLSKKSGHTTGKVKLRLV